MAKVLEPGSALRLQLEGRWERIEQAQERYGALTKLLASSDWRELLRSQPRLPAEVQAQEPGLDEVLEYVERRARLEHWSARHPGPASIRAIRAQRTRLEVLARKRLAQVLPKRAASFMELLGQLESLALAPVPLPPGELEVVLLEGRSWLPPGRFWLMPDRLVWYPWRGEPEQVFLNTLGERRVALLQEVSGVLVAGERRISLGGTPIARQLAAFLKNYRQPPQPSENQVYAVISRRGYRDVVGSGRKADAQPGMFVFRPDYLAFLPERRPTLLDRVLYFIGVASPHEPEELQRLEQLLGHLRHLPDAEFDRWVGEIARARGGELWMSSSVHRVAASYPNIRLMAGGQALAVTHLTHEDKKSLDQFIRDRWPHGHMSPPGRPSWWARHSRALKYFGAGVGLTLTAFIQGSPLPEGVRLPIGSFASVLILLAFMRYVRIKGYQPLLGLLSILGFVTCPIMLVIYPFLPDRNGKPPDFE